MLQRPTVGPRENYNMQSETDDRYARYMRCTLLNVIQHIDIYGKFQSSYAEPRRSRKAPPITVAMSSCPRPGSSVSLKPSKSSLETRLSQMSTTTKTSSLYPGHDILSRRKRYKYLPKVGKELICNAVVPRS